MRRTRDIVIWSDKCVTLYSYYWEKKGVSPSSKIFHLYKVSHASRLRLDKVLRKTNAKPVVVADDQKFCNEWFSVRFGDLEMVEE